MGLWSRSGFMEVFHLCNLIVFLSGGVNLANGEGLDVSSEGELVQKLLSSYHKHGRPVLDAKKPINVTLGVTLQQIQEVDPKKETLTALVWLNLEWKDEFLRWNASQAGDIDKLRMNVEDIWVPDIEVYNQVSQKGLRDREQVVLESTGDIFWIPPLHAHHQQKCDIKFGSWTHHGWQLDIKTKSEDMDTSGYVRNEDWDLAGAVGKRNEVYYECCPEPYLDVTYTVHLVRRPPTHIQRHLVPSALLTYPL